MRDAFNKPTGSLESFKKKTSDWTQRHSKLVQTLILSTGEDLD